MTWGNVERIEDKTRKSGKYPMVFDIASFAITFKGFTSSFNSIAIGKITAANAFEDFNHSFGCSFNCSSSAYLSSNRLVA